MNNTIVSAFLCLSFFAIISFANSVPFDPSRLKLVDYSKRNFLFRSNSPLTQNLTSFNYTGIISMMKKEARSNGIPFSDNFFFIDITLLNPEKKTDAKCLAIEKQFFNEGMMKMKGKLIEWPIHGENYMPQSIRNCTHRQQLINTFGGGNGNVKEWEWSKDRLPQLVIFLQQMMIRFGPGPNRVILVHCMHGVDRTGEVIGAYEMSRAINPLNICQVVDEDTKIKNDGTIAPKPYNYNALLWYTEWLKSK